MRALFTTKKDFSAAYFQEHGWTVFDYAADSELKLTDSRGCRLVYFRDPFNNTDCSYDRAKIDHIISTFSDVRSIDNIRSFDDMLRVEDKLFQASLYRSLCPQTFLPSQQDFIEGNHLAKKRISQRAKDILFELTAPINDDWIIQELLDIKEELRVYSIFGRVVEDATIKTSKQSGKVKVVGGRKITAEEKDFCSKIAKLSKMDFIGIDMAILADGGLKLIEVNRSPQFKRFVEIYGESPLNEILDA